LSAARSRARTAKHRLEYAAFRALTALLRVLPERAALRLGAALGVLAGPVLGIRRRVVRENLARAFPGRPPAWRRAVARAAWAHLGGEAAALFRMGPAGARALLERTTVVGLDALRAALDEGRGAVLVTGHLGNWEIGGAALAARGVRLHAVAQAQANPHFSADLRALRERMGMTVIDRRAVTRAVLRALRSGGAVAFVADQDAGARGLSVDFFGSPASTARGPALFALRTGAPLFLGVVLREPGKPHRYTVTIERVGAEPTGDVRADVRRLTAAHVEELERAVRRAPTQYFWPHRRWKTEPPAGTGASDCCIEHVPGVRQPRWSRDFHGGPAAGGRPCT